MEIIYVSIGRHMENIPESLLQLLTKITDRDIGLLKDFWLLKVFTFYVFSLSSTIAIELKINKLCHLYDLVWVYT